MAGIDKTYISSKKQYYEVKEWAKGRLLTSFYEFVDPYYPKWGRKLTHFYLSDWIREYSEEEMNEVFSKGKELVLWNTPEFVDAYLIQHCEIPFIVERLKAQYGNSYDKIKKQGFAYNDKFIHIYNPHVKLKGKFKKKGVLSTSIYVTVKEEYLWYLDEIDKWVSKNYPWSILFTNSSFFWVRGVIPKKTLMRWLRKWQLPKGAEVCIQNEWKGHVFRNKIIKIK